MISASTLSTKEDFLSSETIIKEQDNTLSLLITKQKEGTVSLKFNSEKWNSLSVILEKDSILHLSLLWPSTNSSQAVDFNLEEGATLFLEEFDFKGGIIDRKGKMTLRAHSKVERTVLNLSTGERKINWNCDLIGEGAEFTSKEAHFGINKSITKNVITIVHKADNTKSNVQIKTALKDASTNFSHGIVTVEKDVMNANTFLSTQALILDKNATAQAIPSLEIESSEVQAGHAASVSTINEDHLFYLTTRGLSEIEAKRNITNAFLAEIFNSEEITTLIDQQWQSTLTA